MSSQAPIKAVTITVFQALTLLAQKYRKNTDMYERIKMLYLSGISNEQDEEQLQLLLADEALNPYVISVARHDINEDPVRRYFESHLCHEILKESLDDLDKNLLERHFESLFNLMSSEVQTKLTSNVFSGTKEGSARTTSIETEYAEGIRILMEKNSYPLLKPEQGIDREHIELQWQQRKEKLILLAKCTLSALRIDNKDSFPLNVYQRLGSAYDPSNRGRIPRVSAQYGTAENKHVRPYNLGIMRAYMPVPRTDALFAPQAAEYARPVDTFTYIDDDQPHEVPDAVFATKVTPFINSISGTLLGQLRAIAQLRKEQQYVYETAEPQELEQFFKLFIAFMIYNAGGHSLKEFMMVFLLPEIQEEFKNIPGISALTLESLFKNRSDVAFERAVALTIDYNRIIINHKRIHTELIAPQIELMPERDKLLERARAHLKPSSLPPIDHTFVEQEIDKLYRIYSEPCITDIQKSEIGQELSRLLVIHCPKIDELDKLINERMAERTAKLKASLFANTEGAFHKRLDTAWDIYQDEKRLPQDQSAAQAFLIYALDLSPDTVHLPVVLQELMNKRAQLKENNPEFIPGKSMECHLSEGPSFSHKANTNRLMDKKRAFLSIEERELYRVLIYQGLFTQESDLFDTSNSQSNHKKEFAPYILNAHGELSIFPQLKDNKSGIEDAAKNPNTPAVAAGELKIKNGKLISIADHSKYYRPTAYHLFRTLEYFKKQGVDVSEVTVLMLIKPKHSQDILFRRSPDFPRFFVCNAEALCATYNRVTQDVATSPLRLI